jgi:hypothetical protein
MNSRLVTNHLQLRRLSLVLALVAAQLGLLAIVASSADATAARWYLRNSNTGGVSNIAFNYGDWSSTMTPIAGDWDSNLTDTPGMFDTAGGSPANWHLRNFNSAGPANVFFEYGLASGKPVVRAEGCWSAGEAGVYKEGAWYLRQYDGSTVLEHFGNSPYIPAVGSYGNRYSCSDYLVLFNPATGHWKVRSGNEEWSFYYGNPGDIPLWGDWDRNLHHEPGIYRPSTSQFHLAYDSVPPMQTATIFSYGNPGAGWKPVIGDWDGDLIDTIGLVAPAP